MKNILDKIKFSSVPDLIVTPRKKTVPRFSISILGRVVNFGHKEVTDWPVRLRAFAAPNTARSELAPEGESESQKG